MLLPVPAVYFPSLRALVPDSLNSHPTGSVDDVPVFASVSKFCVYAVPPEVRLMHWEKAWLVVNTRLKKMGRRSRLIIVRSLCSTILTQHHDG